MLVTALTLHIYIMHNQTCPYMQQHSVHVTISRSLENQVVILRLEKAKLFFHGAQKEHIHIHCYFIVSLDFSKRNIYCRCDPFILNPHGEFGAVELCGRMPCTSSTWITATLFEWDLQWTFMINFYSGY